MAQNFGAATTYTCITQIRREPPQGRLRTCYAKDDKAAMRDPEAYFSENAVVQKDLSEMPWGILSPERHVIKKQVEAQGVRLQEWDIQINYGIKTGFNDAFYLTQEQRDAFVAADPKCAGILVPLLRGRHVSRYATDWDGTWMIATFPVLGLKEAELPRPILSHLSQFRSNLEPKPANWAWKKWDGRKAGRYMWFETQDVIGYHEEFSKPKIMYPNMTKFLPFYYDAADGFFINNKGFIINSDTGSLCYIVAFLNSHLFRCCFRDNFPELMGNTYEVGKIFVDILPVRKPHPDQAALFDKLIPLVQFAKAAGEAAPAQFLEDVIDACVMECYFREHMAERDLLFFDDLAPRLAAYVPVASETKQRDFLDHLHRTLNAPDAKIRNRLLRLTADSPDLLAVIKEEGKV